MRTMSTSLTPSLELEKFRYMAGWYRQFERWTQPMQKIWKNSWRQRSEEERSVVMRRR
jgi:hypothetical protein